MNIASTINQAALSHVWALAFGPPAAAHNIGRARRWSRAILDRAEHEAGRGNVVTATALVALYLVGL